jgi:AcrR family transcriptional regulator
VDLTPAAPAVPPAGPAPAGAPGPVQSRILAAAVALFAEKGFDATSVQEIVERAAVTKGALYHYFSAKDDLLYEIYHALIAAQQAELDRIVAAGLPAADTVRAIVVDVVESTTARLRETAVFAREMHRLGPRRTAEVRAERRTYHAAFRRVIADGQAAGVFSTVASAETVTLMVFGIVNQLPSWYRPDGPKTARQLGDEIADFVLVGLAPHPTTPGGSR